LLDLFKAGLDIGTVLGENFLHLASLLNPVSDMHADQAMLAHDHSF
jgi:hypothetical protein